MTFTQGVNFVAQALINPLAFPWEEATGSHVPLASGSRVWDNSLINSLDCLLDPSGRGLAPFWPSAWRQKEWKNDNILLIYWRVNPLPPGKLLERGQWICLWDFPPLGKSKWFCQDLSPHELNPAPLKCEHRGAGASLSDSKPKLSTSYSSLRFCKC